MADLANAVPIEQTSVFNIASVSKQFTAFALLLAEAQGLLNRDDALARHVPELAAARDITLRHLVHHTSGLPDYIDILIRQGHSLHETTTREDALVALVEHVETQRGEPGERFAYCNSGYFLLSLCIERVSGRSLAAFCADEIFTPLGMISTSIVDRYPADLNRLVRGYRQTVPGVYAPYESLWEQTGDGQVHTNVVDLARWDAHLRGGTLGGRDVLAAQFMPGRLSSGHPLHYAAGLELGYQIGQPTVGHEGAWAGYRANFVRMPEKDLTVAVLANSAEFDVAGLSLQLLAEHM